ncbi:MAG: GNAT family N-acetyltransferase [Candidatus Izemoplasmatales bacterium]
MEFYQGLELREPNEKEFREWFKISTLQQAKDRTYVNVSNLDDELLIIEQQISHLLHNGKDTANHYFRVLCLDKKENIGFIWFGHIPNLGDLDIMLMDIIINHDFRRQGYGRMMLLQMHQVMKKKGYQRIILYVLHKNPARYLYSSLGYKTIKENDKSSLMMISL